MKSTQTKLTFTDLQQLIQSSQLLDDSMRQRWLTLLPNIAPEQLQHLANFFKRERQINTEYQKKVSEAKDHLLRNLREQQEKRGEMEDETAAANLLEEINNLKTNIV